MLGIRVPQESLRVAHEIMQISRMRDSKELYEARFRLLNRMSRNWGFEIYNRHLMWQDDPGFWNVWRTFPGWEGQRADRKFVVWTLAQHASRLAGDSVECGVFEGASSYLICTAYRQRQGHRHHVFDSFQGLSHPGAADEPTSSLAPRWRAGDLAASLETVRRNLSQFDGVEYYPGWIPGQFHKVEDRRFSFVHIDVDLYQPTRDSLEFFYPRLVQGGVLLCDDYGSHQCMGARRAFDEFVQSRPERSVIHLPTIQGFIIRA